MKRREQTKLGPQEEVQLLILKLIIQQVIRVGVLLACVYVAVFDVPFGSILPNLAQSIGKQSRFLPVSFTVGVKGPPIVSLRASRTALGLSS